MKYKKRPDAVLLLDDGTVFHGKAVGKIGTATGEIAFNTGMYGYQEIFTDPSYYGQILLLTTSHVGNYGVSPDEIESDSVKIEGLVCKKFSEDYSRPAAKDSLQNYFEKNERVGISDVDTRALTRHIRSQGAMNAIVSSEITDLDKLKAQLKEVPSMSQEAADILKEIESIKSATTESRVNPRNKSYQKNIKDLKESCI